MEDAGAVQQQQAQGVVLVVLDVNKDICTHALNWALGHVARKGDALRLVGVLSHVLNPMGYKCRVDENSWLGANRRILESELSNKRYLLQNIESLDVWCEKAGVQLVIEVKAGLHPKLIVVEEARKSSAYHVVIDRTMKKDRKYFIDNLQCFVTRVRNSGGVDSVRSFALSNPPTPVLTSTLRSLNVPTPFNTAQGSFSKNSSLNSSLRGSSVSSTRYNQDNDCNDQGPQQLWKQDPMNSSGTSFSCSSFDIRSNYDEFFSTNQDPGPPPLTEPSSTDSEAAFGLSLGRRTVKPEPGIQQGSPSMNMRDERTPSLHYSGSLPVSRALAGPSGMPKTNLFFSRSISDRIASGRLGSREKTLKSVWVRTSSKDVMTASVEAGWTTFVFTPDTKDLADDWTLLARIRPLFLEGGHFLDSQNRQIAAFGEFRSGEQLGFLRSMMAKAEVVVLNAPHGQATAAPENMVAAFEESSTALFAVANTASEAQVYLEALNKGTDGVVIHTDDPSEIYALKAYLKGRTETTMGVRLVRATVTQVEPVGLGDRVCVDLCNLLNPGEGLLVGSFARALFLVHSEWSDIDPVASRPFRVNAGAVHAYVGMAGGVTSYLSDLHTGSQVMVVDPQGHSRTVVVGRVKIESRPLLLVEVEVEGQNQSVLLQNSETVSLVTSRDHINGNAVPVTSLKIGDSLLLNLQDIPDQSGVEIQDYMVEK